MDKKEKPPTTIGDFLFGFTYQIYRKSGIEGQNDYKY